MPSSYNLPDLVKKEIDALVKAGYYSSKSDVVKDALRTFLYSRKDLRIAVAIELYKREEITLGKAAEISGMNVVEFKDRLKDFGIKRTIVSESSKKIRKAIAEMQRKYG